MGDLCEKSDFPLEKMKILFKKSEKKVWLDQEWWGGGVQNMEKYFFAFDELGHLEAKNKYTRNYNNDKVESKGEGK